MTDAIMNAASTLVAAVIAALISLRVFQGGKRSDTAREQLNSVYAKLFVLIEPKLYEKLEREDCDQLVSQIERIAVSGRPLTDPELLRLIQNYKKAPAGKLSDYPKFRYSLFANEVSYLYLWFCICIHIDRTYDLLCKKSFLPIRDFKYRLEKMQYVNYFVWFLNLLRLIWLEMTLLIALLVFFIAIAKYA